jgi:type IV fimbrial biogenesis protein FimT
MKIRSLHHGFTLVELAAVLAVAAVLAGLAVPGIADLIATRRLEGVAAQLATDIQFVRSDAVARNTPVRLSVLQGAEGGCYVVHTGPAAQCRCSASGPALCGGTAREIKTVPLPAREGVVLQSNAASLLFDPLHGTVSPTATLRLVGAQGRAIHHIVNLMGRVRSCSPQGNVAGQPAC